MKIFQKTLNMLKELSLEAFLSWIYADLLQKIETFWPKAIFAMFILFCWILISIVVYKITLYLYVKLKIAELINKIEIDLENPVKEQNEWVAQKRIVKKVKKLKLTERINLDKIIAKSFSYYVFLLFFRFAIVAIWISEVENFLNDLLSYLPSLFVWVLIWFFWVKFSDTVYSIVYHTLEITKQKTGKIIAMWAKIIILFFTIMLVLNYIKIVDAFIINTFIIGFVWAVSLGCAIAFGLGWKDVAAEILEGFKK